jgi:hypothetical protein
MVGRAEFAYFIAIMAKSLNMMNDKLFSVLIWALLYATILAPLVFRYVLKQYMAKMENEGKADGEISKVVSQSTINDSGHLPDFEQEKEDEARAALGDIGKQLAEKERMLAEKVELLASLDAQIAQRKEQEADAKISGI